MAGMPGGALMGQLLTQTGKAVTQVAKAAVAKEIPAIKPAPARNPKFLDPGKGLWHVSHYLDEFHVKDGGMTNAEYFLEIVRYLQEP